MMTEINTQSVLIILGILLLISIIGGCYCSETFADVFKSNKTSILNVDRPNHPKWYEESLFIPTNIITETAIEINDVSKDATIPLLFCLKFISSTEAGSTVQMFSSIKYVIMILREPMPNIIITIIIILSDLE